jgi:hypothetical protein
MFRLGRRIDQIKISCNAILESAWPRELRGFSIIDSETSSSHFARVTPDGIPMSVDRTPITCSAMNVEHAT